MRFRLLFLAVLLPTIGVMAEGGAAFAARPLQIDNENKCRSHLTNGHCNDEAAMRRSWTVQCEEGFPLPVLGNPPSLVNHAALLKLCQQSRENCVNDYMKVAKEGCDCVKRFPNATRPIQAEPEPKPEPGRTEPVARPSRPARPSDEPTAPPLDTSHCQGSESCLSDAARRQREAEELARQRQKDMERYGKDSQRTKNSSITSAADFMDLWERAIAANPRASQSEIARYQNDRRLVERAITDPAFSRQDAQAATVRGLRGDLELFADNGEAEKYYQKEADKAADDQKKLAVLAKETESRVRNLGRASGARAPAAATQALPEPATNFTSAAKPEGGNRSTIAVTRREELPPGGGPEDREPGGGGKGPGADASAVSAAGGFRAGAGGGHKGPSLRDMLKQRLSDKGGRDRDALDGKSFGNGLERAGSGLRGAGNGNAGVAAEVLAGAERGQLGGNGQAFGIGAEETSQQMRRMLREAGIEGDQERTGLLGMDTVSLFERVRQAHRSCEVQGCVRHVAPSP